MSPRELFMLSVALALVTWSYVAAKYLWPVLESRPKVDALRPLLSLQAFRFVGLAFLIPGVVSPDLPSEFARPAAYGDLTTAILALASLAILNRAPGIALAWLTNVVGTVDLLYAFYQGNAFMDEPGLMGAMYFVPTVLVPLLLVAHVLAFRILVRRTS